MAMSSKDGTFCLGAAVWNLDGGEVMTISCNDCACWGETRAGGGKGAGHHFVLNISCARDVVG